MRKWQQECASCHARSYILVLRLGYNDFFLVHSHHVVIHPAAKQWTEEKTTRCTLMRFKTVQWKEVFYFGVNTNVLSLFQEAGRVWYVEQISGARGDGQHCGHRGDQWVQMCCNLVFLCSFPVSNHLHKQFKWHCRTYTRLNLWTRWVFAHRMIISAKSCWYYRTMMLCQKQIQM